MHFVVFTSFRVRCALSTELIEADAREMRVRDDTIQSIQLTRAAHETRIKTARFLATLAQVFDAAKHCFRHHFYRAHRPTCLFRTPLVRLIRREICEKYYARSNSLCRRVMAHNPLLLFPLFLHLPPIRFTSITSKRITIQTDVLEKNDAAQNENERMRQKKYCKIVKCSLCK